MYIVRVRRLRLDVFRDTVGQLVLVGVGVGGGHRDVAKVPLEETPGPDLEPEAGARRDKTATIRVSGL